MPSRGSGEMRSLTLRAKYWVDEPLRIVLRGTGAVTTACYVSRSTSRPAERDVLRLKGYPPARGGIRQDPQSGDLDLVFGCREQAHVFENQMANGA